MTWDFVRSYSFARPAARSGTRGALAAALSFVVLGLALLSVAPSTLAQERPPAAQPPAPQGPAAEPPPGTLLKVVILSRHGVRSPLVEPKVLATWTASSWPKWQCENGPCCEGYLTPQGGRLAQQMGQYYGEYYRRHGLLPSGSCPATNDLWFWADADQRTIATGESLLQGLLPPGCDVQPYLNWHGKTSSGPHPYGGDTCKKGEDVDRIFHPVTGDGACRIDPDRAEKAMLRHAGGSLDKLIEKMRKPLDRVQCTLQCCLHEPCEGWWQACGLQQQPPACTLADRVSRFNRLPHDKPTTRVQLEGPPRIASTFAELVLLEYANNFPESEVGFGRTRMQDRHEMFRAHTEAFNIELRTPYIAKLQGSRLLSRILAALQGQGGSDGTDGIAPAGARFVTFVGHDTNIANLAAMLKLHWKQQHYQQDQTPPAGALIFELRQGTHQKTYVHAFYAAQSPDEMRNLQGTHPKRTRQLFMKPLSLYDFAKLVSGLRDPNQGCWD